jgi:hypothetical protein
MITMRLQFLGENAIRLTLHAAQYSYIYIYIYIYIYQHLPRSILFLLQGQDLMMRIQPCRRLIQYEGTNKCSLQRQTIRLL